MDGFEVCYDATKISQLSLYQIRKIRRNREVSREVSDIIVYIADWTSLLDNLELVPSGMEPFPYKQYGPSAAGSQSSNRICNCPSAFADEKGKPLEECNQ